MKLKYFLRGLGAGIIFGAVIMLVAYMTSGGYKLSDKEIISRAEKLGMVMQEDQTASSGDADGKSDITTTESPLTEDNSESVTTEVEKEDKTTEEKTTEEKTTVEETTEEVTEDTVTTEAVTTEENTSARQDGEYTTAKITVVGGMGSEQVAKLLEEAGIIKDAADFDSYLNKNGYSTRIEIGTFEVNSGMTYEEIATILSTKQ
ncbi:MAG: hypothetical protein ACI39Q_02695 [Wujia sp.]